MKKAIVVFIVLLFSFGVRLFGQTRTIHGRVVSEYLEELPLVNIQNAEKVVVGKTGMDGRFKIEVPQNTRQLFFNWIGFEQAVVNFTADCDTIELVLLGRPTYDFMSSRKIDRSRLKQFKKAPEVYLQAYNKGLFTKRTICYTRDFEPIKPALDKIAKHMAELRKGLRSIFEKLAIGDTIRIPFAGDHRSNLSDTVKLHYYYITADRPNYDCVIQVVIIGKNKKKSGNNLICKVISCEQCKGPAIYAGKVMVVGEVFTYNMKYFKILNN